MSANLSAPLPLTRSLARGATDIRAFCKGQIAHYKVPRYIRFVSGFPMTVTGKIQKFKIRDEMKNQLGLEEDKTA